LFKRIKEFEKKLEEEKISSDMYARVIVIAKKTTNSRSEKSKTPSNP
jgi:hypothetical protein